jgi:3-deoxy-D-manno-octulosonic-acid transferase
MINTYDIAYASALGVSAPYWLVKPGARRKVLRALSQRMGQVPVRDSSLPAIMIHAVSVGEINVTRSLVDVLRAARPGVQFILSTTTEDGSLRSKELYGSSPDMTLIRYPLDFSGAIGRVLDRLRPTLVVLMELEVWPNFLRRCAQRGIPVVLANGRLTQASFRKYQWIKPVVAAMFARLAVICAQEQTYAERFIQLGAPMGHVRVAGTMKFDSALIADSVPGAAELGAALGIEPGGGPVWVCGSTGPGEEQIILRVYRDLLTRHSRLRLLLAPRHRARFDEVADLIAANQFKLIRRSKIRMPSPGVVPPVILGDTMGELPKFYSLADVVFVGRTLMDLGPRQHGSDMIEPAALAKPVIVGPFTGNFTEPMNRFRSADAIRVVRDESQLGEAIGQILAAPQPARQMGLRAQAVVRHEQGATARHVQAILEQFDQKISHR